MTDPIWTAPATVAAINGAPSVTLVLYGQRVTFPVNLLVEARMIVEQCDRPLTLALLAAPADGARSLEDDLVYQRAEVIRLRELLAAKAPNEAAARVETGRSVVFVTCRGEDAERRVETEAARMLADETTRRKVAAAENRATVAEANEANLSNMLRAALLVIREVIAAEGNAQR